MREIRSLLGLDQKKTGIYTYPTIFFGRFDEQWRLSFPVVLLLFGHLVAVGRSGRVRSGGGGLSGIGFGCRALFSSRLVQLAGQGRSLFFFRVSGPSGVGRRNSGPLSKSPRGSGPSGDSLRGIGPSGKNIRGNGPSGDSLRSSGPSGKCSKEVR